jgi:hypothetical protein
MLFDLRGRGRRRTVQAIYLGLAILIGVGLVGFGIGGGFGGTGVINAITNNSGSSGGVSFSAQVAKAQKLANAQPQNPAAWAALINALYSQAGSGSNYNSVQGAFTNQARPTLNQLSLAWQRYLAVNPNHPDPLLAARMVAIYGPQNNALNQPAKALAAQQIVLNSKTNPTLADYQSVALLAFLAKNVREGDLAAAKAISLAPQSQRAQLRTEFKLLRANPNALAQAQQQAAQQTGPQTFSVPTKTPPAATATTSAAATTSKK